MSDPAYDAFIAGIARIAQQYGYDATLREVARTLGTRTDGQPAPLDICAAPGIQRRCEQTSDVRTRRSATSPCTHNHPPQPEEAP